MAFQARLRWAIHAPCLCFCPATHARGWFRVQAQRRAPVFPGCEKAPARPPRTETSEKLSFAPWLFKRACGGQFTHSVCIFAQPRTHAAGSVCVPAHGSCFPGQGGNLVSVPCGREETRRAKAPAHPPRTETSEKLSFAPWLFRRFPCQPAVCGLKGRVSRPAARKRG